MRSRLRHKRPPPDPDASGVLGDLLRRLLREHPIFLANPIGDWDDIVGAHLARYSSPRELKNGCLTVICFDSIWKHQLEMLREEILDRIRRLEAAPRVQRIVFRIGELPEADAPINANHRLLEKLAPKRRKRKRPKLSRRALTAAEEALVKGLPDKDLRAMARRILSRIPLQEPALEPAVAPLPESLPATGQAVVAAAELAGDRAEPAERG